MELFHHVGVLLLLKLVATAVQAADSGLSPTVRTFLSDNVYQQNSTRPNPVDLGQFPYECVGNVLLCPNGFTLSLWYRPDQGQLQNPALYVLSSGAQSALSPSGVYIRQNYGQEYELAVAVSGTIYKVKVSLLVGSWANIALTFSTTSGLTVYVDGQLVGSDATGSSRLSAAGQYNPFQNIFVGQRNDIPLSTSSSGLAVWNITHVNMSMADGSVDQFTTDVAGALFIGCSTFNSGPRGVANTAASQSMAQCRDVCHSNQLNIAVFQLNTGCLCVDYAGWLNWLTATPGWLKIGSPSSCTGSEKYQVAWSSHINYAPVPPAINLDVTVRYPVAGKPSVRPYETVTFQLSTNTLESVVFQVDFGDGSSLLRTTDTVIGYAWSSPGQHTVNVTAVTRSNRQTQLQTITIDGTPTGNGPTGMVIESGWDMINDFGVLTYFQAYSDNAYTCTVSSGDQTPIESLPPISAANVLSFNRSHIYPRLGLYHVTLTCENQFDQTISTETALSIQTGVPYESYALGTDVTIAISGATSASVQVFIDGSSTPTSRATINSTHLVLPASLFSTPGEHSVVVKTVDPNAFNLLNKVYDVLTPVSGVTLKTSAAGVLVNQPIQWTLTILQGDQMFVEFDFGDGQSQLVYVSASPATVTASRAYPSLGQRTVTVTVANDVSSSVVTALASVERPVASVSMSTTNVTSLGQPTTFTFSVDPTISPSMPITVAFDFDDGNKQTVTLGTMQTNNVPYVFTYIYQQYGIYRVSAKVGNNVSMNALPVTIVQVGENITSLDLYVDKQLVQVDQYITVTIQCPKGSPVALSVNMGDGLPPVVLTQPDNYQPLNQDRTYPTPASTVGTTPTPVVPTTPGAKGTRRRRQAVPSSSATSSTVNAPFIVTYKYAKAGRYQITATANNSLSTTSSALCPRIVVVSTSTTAPKCQPLARITNSSTLAAPSVYQRSAVISIAASAELQCTPTSAQQQPLFTWTVDRLVGVNVWKPELTVCLEASSNPILTIFSNTLWYGIYRVNVTVSIKASVASSDPLSTDLSPPATTYLSITPTPLVASIVSEGGQTNFAFSESPALNTSMSFDPDVESWNSSGLYRYVFCYPQSTASRYSSLGINQLLNESIPITYNSDENAGIYYFPAASCFTSTNHSYMLGFEAVISASNLITTEKLVFMVVVTKDTRSARDSIVIQAYPTLIGADALDNLDLTNPAQALSIIAVVTGGLGDNQSADAVAQRMQLRTKLLNCLDKVSTRLQNVDQIALATNAVSAVTASPDEVTPNAKATAATAISSTANMATSLATNASEGTVASITQGMLTGVGQILPVDPEPEDSNFTTAAPSTTPRSTTTTTPRPPLTQPRRRYGRAAGSNEVTTVDPSLVDDDNYTAPEPCCESIAVGLCDWIEPVGFMCVDESDRKRTAWTDYECEMTYPDDMKTYTDRYNAWLDEQRRLANEIKKKITTNGMGAFGTIGGVLLGKQDEGAGKTVNSPSVNMTVMKTPPGQAGGGGDGFSLPAGGMEGMGGALHVQSKNPYTYSNDPANPQVSGNVQTLSLVDANGNPMPVTNSSTPFVIEMAGSATLPEATQYSVKSGNITYNRVSIPSNFSAIMAVIKPLDPTVILAVYLKYTNYSNETYYDWYTTIPNKAAASSSQQYLFYPPQEYTALNGTYFLGISVNGTTTGAPPAANYTYSIYTYSAACLYWNETGDVWSSEGCSVSPDTTPLKTICLCTHLTSFGSNAFVAPNTIDFSTVFTAEKFLESIPVFVTVIVLIALWIVICIWARHMDKKDVARWGAVPLEDNVPVDTYFYQLSVYTGLRRNAGTNSRPSFILSGDDGDTGVRVLYDGKRKEHSAGSINNYILGVEDNLGPLNFLRIWHDNSGKGNQRGWFLDQVHVQDLQTGEKFYFVCNRWLAVEEDDGQIERILPVAGIDDLTQFSGMFSTSVRKKFSNDHMWASIFSRPTRSNFTRVQRVSSCVALLFLTMITSCMFFKAVDTDHSTELHIGPITITPQQIMVSIQSTLIVFPPSIAIVTIFRKVRPRNNAVQSEKSSTSSSGWRSHSSGGESDLWQSAEKKSRSEKMRDAIKKITTFHQDSNKTKYEDDGTAKKKKKKPLTFPWWTLFIAWALVLLCIFMSGFFTILYAMQWGHTKAIDWLQTFLLSFAQNVIIVQPAKIFVLAMVLSLIFKKPPQTEEDEEVTSDNQLKPDEEQLTGNVSRSQADIQEILKRRRASHINDKTIANRPDPEQLARERETRLKQIQMDGIIRECIIYIIFVLVVYFLSYQDMDKRSYQFVQNIQNTFTGGDVPFNSITTYADVNGWINKTLLPNLYSMGWYNGEDPKSWHDTQQMNDHVTIRLGIGRLRQLRIKEGSCKISKMMEGVINHCRNDFNVIDEDDEDYGTNWAAVEVQNETCRAYEHPFDPWRHRSAFELKGTPYMGQSTSYGGGGYCFNFRRDYHATQTKFNELAQTDWLDSRTRALFIEFTLYNGNANLFGSVVMLIEFLADGGPILTSDVKTFRLTNYEGGAGLIVVAVQAIFVIFIIYFLYNIITSIKKQKRAYFGSFWNCLEFVTTILSIISIAMFAMKVIFGKTAMGVLNEAGTGEYVNFVSIAVWAQMYIYLLGFVVFIATIKLLNMLRFNRRMGMLTTTIRVAAKEMVYFMITFVIVLLSFASWSYLLFSTQLVTYYTFTATLQSLFRFFVGQFEFTDYVQAQPSLGPVFFFLYVLIGFMGLQAMFITIITEAFQKVRSDPNMQQNDYEVVDYIFQKIKGVLSIITGDSTEEAKLREGEKRGAQAQNTPADGGRDNPAFLGARAKEVGETNVQITFESADD